MTEPRLVELPGEAASSIDQILGIVLDSFMGSSPSSHVGAFGWGFDVEHVVELEQRLRDVWSAEELSRGEGVERAIELSMEDVALILHGMAFTEVMSADLPWIDMERWTSDFVTTQLRAPWTDEEWEAFGVTGG